MTQHQPELAVLFADIVDSTQMYESLGDASARAQMQKSIQLLVEVTVHRRGRLIKTIGDEVMCRFDSVDDAALAACDMQRVLSQGAAGSSPGLKVGFEYGPVIEEDGDVFGDAVNVAARMAGSARGGQVLTTARTINAMSPTIQQLTRVYDRARVKGKSELLEIHEVIWADDDAVTRISTRLNDGGHPQHVQEFTQLVLQFAGESRDMGANDASLIVGRGDDCDVVIDCDTASRRHAAFEYHRGKFVLRDQSTNGTYVLADDGAELFARRETVPLVGDGLISLGKPIANQTGVLLRYRCK